MIGLFRIMPNQHNSKQIKRLFKELEKRGFTISKKSKSGVVKILPPDSVPGPIYSTHATESALHQIRRDFVRIYGVNLRQESKRGERKLVSK